MALAHTLELEYRMERCWSCSRWACSRAMNSRTWRMVGSTCKTKHVPLQTYALTMQLAQSHLPLNQHDALQQPVSLPRDTLHADLASNQEPTHERLNLHCRLVALHEKAHSERAHPNCQHIVHHQLSKTAPLTNRTSLRSANSCRSRFPRATL